MPTMIFTVTIQGNVPYNQNSMVAQPMNTGPHHYTSCREINVVTDTIRDAIALASSTLKPTEVITNVYTNTNEVLVDSSCIPRG